jgi:hypothetical protein
MAKTKIETFPHCEHGRMGDACEDWAYQRAKDAGLRAEGPPPAETRAANEQAASDDETATMTTTRTRRRR